ncbi:LuxR C-terminal-related transcriptional regulator [Streptomyces sp. 21So2-11]|uniref:helix-turn-helix transcriptional regulator n=1 Tax=Streptomyces sp. 21So2-11 TaxID=3144408 RepID=UPI00321A5C4A
MRAVKESGQKISGGPVLSGIVIDQWFTGRQRELTALANASRTPRTRPRLIKVPGEAGIGKTRLLTEFLTLAAENSDATVLGSTAAEDQHGPFDMLTSMLGTALPGHAQWSLAPLVEAAGPGGPVLVVDDLHLATHGINVALEQLLRHPTRTDLLVVVAYRSRGIANRLLAALGTAQSQWDIEDLPLGPLDGAAAEGLYPEHLCGRHRMTVYEQSGGNPRYLDLLMALCQGANCSGESLLRAGAELPHEVTAPILMDLDKLSATAQVVCQAAAVIGDSFDLELTTLVAGFDRATVLVAIDELLTFDLVQAESVPGCFRFRHPVLRGVAYRSAPDGWRLGAHARAVEALRRGNQPAVRIAEHVERVGGDGPDSVAVLIAAGRATALCSPDTAASWYRTALRLLGDGPEHREQRLQLLTALARGAVLTGRLDDGRDALDARDALIGGGTDDAADAADAADALECRAQLAVYAGRYTEARAMLNRAVVRRGPGRDSTQLRLALAATSVWDTGWEWSEDALLSAAGSGDNMLQVLALGIHATVALSKGASDVALRSVCEAAQLVDRQPDDQLARRIDALCYLGWAQIHAEQFTQADRHFTRGLALSRANGQWQPIVPLLVGLGTAQLRRGHIESAQVHADQAVRLARTPGCEDLLAMALTLRAQVGLAAGATLSALADSRAASDAVTPDSPRWRQARLALAAALLASGEPDECLVTVLDIGGCDSLLDLPIWDHPRAYDLLSRAELAGGRMDEARARAEQVRASAEALGLPGRLGLAAAARARVAADPADALVGALEAVAAGVATDQPLEAGAGHLLAARALLDLGEPARAGKHLDAGEAAAVGSGAGDLLPAVRALRAEVNACQQSAEPAPPGEQHMLSQREFEIANLVSQGRTNRQIARQLEVSHKTVETHLGRIFSKLNVSSRAEIANMVGRASVIARPRRTAAVR